MRRRALVGRGIAATLLTGIVSPLLVAVGAGVFFLVAYPFRVAPQSATQIARSMGEAVAVVGGFGAFIALPCAIVIGLCVEWPKAHWLLIRSSKGLLMSLAISVLAAELVFLSMPFIDIFVRKRLLPSDWLESLAFVASAAVIGGACSAAFWWWLVVRPCRLSLSRKS